MGALSFKERFVEPVLKGLKKKKDGKRQSIRNFRKRPLKVGETVYLYYAMRTKRCMKLGEDIIKEVNTILITETEILIYEFGSKKRKNKLLKVLLQQHELNQFAVEDGFKDFADMKAFWIAEHGKDKSPFPYIGNLYKW